jgi:hypothetical protein
MYIRFLSINIIPDSKLFFKVLVMMSLMHKLPLSHFEDKRFFSLSTKTRIRQFMKGSKTLSTTTHSIMTISIMTQLNDTLALDTQHNVMLNVDMLSVIKLSVIIPSVILLNVIMTSLR